MRAAILLTLAFVSCGGSGGLSGPVPVQFLAAGVSPANFNANSGGSVQFVNHDTVDHQVASADCAELTSPRMAPNAQFTAAMGTGPKTCNFNDSLNPTNAAFQGTVNVLAPGNGY
jgi:plastocyanin